MSNSNVKILVTGGTGFLGRHVIGELVRREVGAVYSIGSRHGDLREKARADELLHGKDIVVHLASDVGGIGYNQDNPGSLFYNNMLMGMNVIDACAKNKVKKLVLVGTVCSYPKFTPVPFKEENLWNGYPEETNAPYGLAKRELFTMAQAYQKQYKLNTVCLLMVNLYGPGDNFDPERSHVIPALIRKFVEAKEKNKNSVVLWGSGAASREFLYVKDAAQAIVLATSKITSCGPMNVGSGEEVTIHSLAYKITKLVSYKGRIVWDIHKPDGQPRRCLDVSKIALTVGWHASTLLDDGLEKTIQWYQGKLKGA